MNWACNILLVNNKNREEIKKKTESLTKAKKYQRRNQKLQKSAFCFLSMMGGTTFNPVYYSCLHLPEENVS